MINKILRPALIGLLVLSGLLGSGCASITRGTKDQLKVVSEPSGAQIMLSNGQTGITPATFTLPRKKGLVVEVSKPGFEPQKVMISSKFAGAGGAALAGNVLVGGLIGAGIDGMTGATLSLKPNPVFVTLVPLAVSAPDEVLATDPIPEEQPISPETTTPPAALVFAQTDTAAEFSMPDQSSAGAYAPAPAK